MKVESTDRAAEELEAIDWSAEEVKATEVV